MFYNAPIEELEAIKERIKKDIKWYRKKTNRAWLLLMNIETRE